MYNSKLSQHQEFKQTYYTNQQNYNIDYNHQIINNLKEELHCYKTILVNQECKIKSLQDEN